MNIRNIQKELFKVDITKLRKIRYRSMIRPFIIDLSDRLRKQITRNFLEMNGHLKLDHRDWSLDLFSKPSLDPLIIGSIEDKNEYSKRNELDQLFIMDMPIKMPYSDVRIPAECEQFYEAIQKIFLHEKMINSDFDKSYCYLCIDQRLVVPGTSQ